MYTIQTIPAKSRVEIIFRGKHDYDFMQFSEELKAAAILVRSSDRHFDLLVDFTEGQVLPRENAEQSAHNISWCIDHGMRRSANVVSMITQKMQVQRVSERNEILHYFETRTEAERWLDSDRL